MKRYLSFKRRPYKPFDFNDRIAILLAVIWRRGHLVWWRRCQTWSFCFASWHTLPLSPNNWDSPWCGWESICQTSVLHASWHISEPVFQGLLPWPFFGLGIIVSLRCVFYAGQSSARREKCKAKCSFVFISEPMPDFAEQSYKILLHLAPHLLHISWFIININIWKQFNTIRVNNWFSTILNHFQPLILFNLIQYRLIPSISALGTQNTL